MRLSDPERVRRLARVLVSDLVTEWADEVRLGLEKDDLFERMGPEIERARVFFLARVAEGLADRERIFNWAVVDGMLLGNRPVHPYVV